MCLGTQALGLRLICQQNLVQISTDFNPMGNCTILTEKSWEESHLFTSLIRTGRKWPKKSRDKENLRRKNMHSCWKNKPKNSSKCSCQTPTRLTVAVQARVNRINWVALAQKPQKILSCKKLKTNWRTSPILTVKMKSGILLEKWERSSTTI